MSACFQSLISWLADIKPLTDLILQALVAIGTIGAVLVALRRPGLRCTVSLVKSTGAIGGQQSRVALQISNPSSRPATLVKIFWKPRNYRDGTIELGGLPFLNGIARNFPLTISEGEFVEVAYPILEGIAVHAIKIEKIKHLSGQHLRRYLERSYFTFVAVHKVLDMRLSKDVAAELANRIEFARAPI